MAIHRENPDSNYGVSGEWAPVHLLNETHLWKSWRTPDIACLAFGPVSRFYASPGPRYDSEVRMEEPALVFSHVGSYSEPWHYDPECGVEPSEFYGVYISQPMLFDEEQRTIAPMQTEKYGDAGPIWIPASEAQYVMTVKGDVTFGI